MKLFAFLNKAIVTCEFYVISYVVGPTAAGPTLLHYNYIDIKLNV